ncbi:putative aquaporin TIP3-1 [Dichanthelium oligosanthes]|uniref:Putative aquaporin TIP3-1 n=1 Tax=Dichanthelium oligosanthes TaxID=888268 RepID=A0A1E5V3Y5_9POAL|nr:putative aquaporin TIP3-1 [Dichanthelium oligosanthes]
MRAGRRRFNVGRLATATDPGTLRCAVAELLATAIFVFAAEGATHSLGRMYHDKGMVSGLMAVALAHALALAAAVACTVNISGGHVNPAITFGALLGGRICLVRSLVYWTAQLLGAVTGALLLSLATGGVRLPEYALAGGMNGWHAAVLEAAMAFGLMYAYYATAMEPPPQRVHAGMTMAPLAMGLLAGANVLACGAFDGAVMNPARAFGPAIVGSRRWGNHWVYWVGPMVGAGLSGVVYEHLVVSPADEEEPAAPSRGSSRRA